MVLVLVVPTYDAAADELTLQFAQTPVAKEVVLHGRIQATYSAGDELLSLTLHKVRAEAPEILQTALRLIDKVGLDVVDAAIPLTVAVLLEYFDVVPDLATLSLPWDGEVGYLTEYVARQLLDPAAADRVIQALAYFKPLTPGTGHPDPLGNAWRFMPLYQPALPAELELLRVPAFRASMAAVLGKLAGVMDTAVEAGCIEIRGDAESWRDSEIRQTADAKPMPERNDQQAAPPAGYATWLDFAVETMDTRSLEIERLLADDDTGSRAPTRDEMRQTARADLNALRQQALLSAGLALRVGQE